MKILSSSKVLNLIKKINNPIFTLSFFFTGITGGVKLLQFLLFSQLAKSLGSELFGLFGLLYTYQVTVNTFSIAGIIEKLPSQYIHLESETEKEKLFKTTNVLFIVIAFFSALGTFLYSCLDTEINKHLDLVAYTILTGAILAFTNIQSTYFRFSHRYVASVLTTNLPLFLSLVSIFIANIYTNDLKLIIIIGLIGSVGGLIVLTLFRLSYGFKIPTKKNVYSEFKIIWPFLIVAIFSLFSGYGINFIISSQLNLSDVGVFTFFVTISSIMHLLANSMNLVWSPHFFELYKSSNIDEVNKKNKKFYTNQAWVLFIAGILINVFFKVYEAQFPDYKDHLFMLPFLFAAYICNISWYMNTNYYIVNASSKRLTSIVVISGLLGMTTIFICIYFFRAHGIYIGFLISYLIKSIMIGLDGKRQWKSDVPWGLIILLMLLMIGVGYLLFVV